MGSPERVEIAAPTSRGTGMRGHRRPVRLEYREDVVEGLEDAPRAFLRLFRGEDFGRLVVQVGDDPSRTEG
jgi:NADPH-dependent curcumin reductase CurA